MTQKKANLTNVEYSVAKGDRVIHKVMFVIAGSGFQPIEYSVPKKILEHSGITIITASDKPEIASANDGTTAIIDKTLDQVSVDDFDALFFIGGPEALDHLDNEKSYQLLRKTAEEKKIFGAICISVRILAKSGVLKGKKVTGWNGDNKLGAILEKAEATYVKKDVIVDGNIITATGPEAAQEFGAKILTILGRN